MLGTLLAVLLTGCPSRQPAEPADDLATLTAPPRYYSGIQANNARCRRCHDPYEPEHFDDAGWERFLPAHCKDCKIDEPTMRMILGYLTKYN